MVDSTFTEVLLILQELKKLSKNKTKCIIFIMNKMFNLTYKVNCNVEVIIIYKNKNLFKSSLFLIK